MRLLHEFPKGEDVINMMQINNADGTKDSEVVILTNKGVYILDKGDKLTKVTEVILNE